MKKLVITLALSLTILSTTVFPVLASEVNLTNRNDNQQITQSLASDISKPLKVTLNKKTAILNIGSTEILIPTILPDTATNKEVTWKSSKPSIVTVNSDGCIEAISQGSSIITVTTIDGNKTATCKVTVPINVTGISLGKTVTTIKLGAKQSLPMKISPTNATNKSITWTSSIPSVANVDEKGKITGLSLGTTVITATTVDSNKVATCELSVGIPVTKIAMNKKDITINEREEETLIATVIPINATNQNLIWESSDDSIATVNSSGKISGIKGGTVTITAITQDGSKISKCKVTIVTGNYPVIFNNAKLEKAVRSSIKKPHGILYGSDVQKITSLNLEVANLVDISGIESLTNLSTLGLGNNKIVDIGALSGLTKLQNLFLFNNKIVDISALNGLKSLKTLHLGQNQIIDINALENLTNLTNVTLCGNYITDITSLKNLTQLTRIELNNNKIEDITSLKELTELTYIELTRNKIKTVSGLTDLVKLEYLYLGDNQISDTNEFKKLIKLKDLNLYSNKISDIVGLLELDNLEYLNLYGNQISEVDKGTLENALPNCSISF